MLTPNEQRLLRFYLAQDRLKLHISRKSNGEPFLQGATWYVTGEDNFVTAYGTNLDRDLRIFLDSYQNPAKAEA